MAISKVLMLDEMEKHGEANNILSEYSNDRGLIGRFFSINIAKGQITGVDSKNRQRSKADVFTCNIYQ